MIARSFRLALLTAALMLAAQPSTAEPSRGQTVQQALAGMTMSDKEMKGMHHMRMSHGKNNYGYASWIPLETCKGSLVIYMDRYYRSVGTGTTGDCTMEHVKSR